MLEDKLETEGEGKQRTKVLGNALLQLEMRR
jgi:hypothetical protein